MTAGRSVWFALVALGISTSATATALAQEAPEPTEEAGRLFEQGMRLLEDENWSGARATFERAYQLAPHYALLFNIGVCRKMLHDYPEAIRAFEAYLREGGDRIAADRRVEAEGFLADLRPLVATVVVQVDVDGAEVLVDGQVRGRAPLAEPVALGAGDHVIAARAEGLSPVESRLQLVGGESQTVALVLRPATPLPVPAPTPELVAEPEPATAAVDAGEGLSPAWFWTSAGLAGALAIGGTVAGVMALVAEDDFNDAADRCARGETGYCDDGPGLSDDYEACQLATNILLPAAAGFAVAAITLAFFTDFGGSEADAPDVQVVVAPIGSPETPTGVAFGITGRF